MDDRLLLPKILGRGISDNVLRIYDVLLDQRGSKMWRSPDMPVDLYEKILEFV